MKTYDIYFTDGNSSDHKGFALKSAEKAIKMAQDMLVKGNSFTQEYAGGKIQVKCSDGEIVWEAAIPAM